LLHEVTPAATKIAFLLNRANRALAESDEKEARDSARALGVNLLVLDASGQSEIDAAFEILIREQAGALMTNSESLFMVQSNPLAALTARHRVPALYAFRENAIAGGLMSYGSNFLTAARELGLYAGRREAARPAGGAVDQVRTFAQPQDREDTRSHHSCWYPRHR